MTRRILIIALILLCVPALTLGMERLQGLAGRYGEPTGGLHQGKYNNSIVLNATSASILSNPTGANSVMLSGTVDFYVKFTSTNESAKVPGVTITDGSASILCPYGTVLLYALDGATQISMISQTASTKVIMQYFK